jgi:hypothetical protein
MRFRAFGMLQVMSREKEGQREWLGQRWREGRCDPIPVDHPIDPNSWTIATMS